MCLAEPFVLRLVVSFWSLGPALRLSSVELSLLLAPTLGMNSLLHSACYLRTACLPSASFLRHFSLAVARLRAPLSRFLEGSLYGHVSAYMLDVLHWLPLQQRIIFRIGAMVGRCILGLAPANLRDLCHPTPGTRGCSSLRSSEQGLLFFLLLVHPQPRPVHSRWLVPLCGMGFRCRKDCSPGFFLTHSTLVSKLFFLAVQGSGALLSSNLEGALYKSP